MSSKDLESHIGYWDGRGWVPWCQFEKVMPTHEIVQDESGELCADCLALALEDLA